MAHLLASRSCWIFDLDGTLTLPVHDFDVIRQELNIPDVSDILDHFNTLPLHEATRQMERLEAIEWELATRANAAPGVSDLLALLAQRGVSLGILTRNNREIALKTLETIGAGRYFDSAHILGRCQVPPKPDPAGIIHLLDQWGGTAADAVMVGDYLFDLQAGRAAGAMTVHVGRPDGQLWPEVSDVMVEDLIQLAEML